MFDQLVDAMSGAWWTYLLVWGICLLDAVLPVVPSETMVITGGVLASSGDLNLVLIMVVGAVGAFAGDNLAYGLGRLFGERVARLVVRGPRGQRTLAWARRTLDRRGVTLIIAARFVPGGRTATTLVAGTTHFDYRRFVPAAAAGAIGWSGYNALLGFVGGSTFTDAPWKGFLLAFGLAGAVSAAIEGGRWLWSRRRPGEDRNADAGGHPTSRARGDAASRGTHAEEHARGDQVAGGGRDTVQGARTVRR
ncbi:DedA family protein [Frankia sp. QA3]|uniref:DedA family protein n=1 Tax=Frankia sp. QA3 TaxID=710111 RepID=UPI000269B968|nr:DedA family protein [Frankia sp. QA3]EIV90727.1 putative membrane-associated protein [Frankia sp. QA3]